MSNSTDPGGIFPGLPSTDPPPPDPTAERCHLLGPTALVVQASMGLMVLGSLVAKRQIEKRKRPWRVWMLDVGKQLIGQAVIHGLNILISSVVADASETNPCSLYFLNILIDTTIGVGIFYVALKWYTALIIKHNGPEGYTSGHYGRPPQWSYWGRQLQPYLAAVVTMKLIVILPLTLPKISNAIIRWGQSMLSWLPTNGQVIFVLAIFPVIMNVFQFCVMDQVIKAGKGTETGGRGQGGDDADAQEMDADYQPIPTAEAETGLVTPRRRNSSQRDLTKAVSRTSSVGSAPLLAGAEERRRLGEGSSGGISVPGIINNVWASIRPPQNTKPSSNVLFSDPNHRDERDALVEDPEDIAMSRLSLESDGWREEDDSKRQNTLGLSTS